MQRTMEPGVPAAARARHSRPSRCLQSPFRLARRRATPPTPVHALPAALFPRTSVSFLACGGGGALIVSRRTMGSASRGGGMMLRFLRLRYLVLGSAVGGGVALHETYESWKDKLPDLKWMKEYFPNEEHLDRFTAIAQRFRQKLTETRLPEAESWLEAGREKLSGWSDTSMQLLRQLGNFLDDTTQGDTSRVFTEGLLLAAVGNSARGTEDSKAGVDLARASMSFNPFQSKGEEPDEEYREQTDRERLDKMQEEMMQVQLKYQREIEKLEKENRELKKQILIRQEQRSKTRRKYKRVVVVGDQSSGKTSVLEMIARARIFPRGSGEMMTRAPVKVTLSEGPYHIASFKDSSREFDLSAESDVINVNFNSGCRRQRLQTQTTEMSPDTRESIRRLCKQYMENPNAIVLCIQGNVNDSISTIRDYEEHFFRNSKLFKGLNFRAAQLTTANMSMAVSECFWKMVKESVEQQADAFKATRFNLETEWKNNFPRVRELDRDELFEKARGEVLDEIINLSLVTPREWEEAFYAQLWKQVSTYVFENIYVPASQADSHGPTVTGESTGEASARVMEGGGRREEAFYAQLWKQVSTYVFENIYVPASQADNNLLPRKCVEVGWDTLMLQFKEMVDNDKKNKDHDNIFDSLKMAVIDEAANKHHWDQKAPDSLRVIQLNALEDRAVPDKQQWDLAIKFMETFLQERLDQSDEQMRELLGPSMREQWMYWKTQTDAQRQRRATVAELSKILQGNQKPKTQLTVDELTATRKNLQTRSVEVDNEFIRETWFHVYRHFFLKMSLQRSQDCKKGFYHYQQGYKRNRMECHDVVLFWRIQRMLQITSNALRQQVMNTEGRRLEKEIKQVLEDYSQTRERKERLLTGRRVQLAEELKRVRQIQEKLEEFVEALNKEK
ncbi:PREDICTED: dynamin-like 120 kDa protein, mitochondrial [Priapulus caudatus]|uniref:dynamin GTPase n=1 Tax=Priapulus caudatus TaxID=37621 RepID=A0ABM1EY65_PRICU|nr:PREDICTED: dynamin-like 120 kDa protein, mitochondrial [Priapulus caudatus]